MRALVAHGPHDFRIERRALPVPGAGEVLLRPLFNGICFTDKHLFDGHIARPGPWTIGHEFSAEVIAAGSGVAAWDVGALVSVEPRLRCGHCLPCRAGLEMLCVSGGFLGVYGADGGLADLCVAPAYCLYPLPDGCSPLQAACVEAACCATRVARSGTIVAGDNVVLLGLEDYNLYMAQWLKGLGACVVAVDPEPVRRETALAFGASHVIDPGSDGFVSAVRALMPFGADCVVVAMEDYVAASADYLRLAHRLARIQGSVVVMRSYGNQGYTKIDPKVAWLKELTIRHFGNFFGNEPARGGRARGDWQVTLEAVARGTVLAPPPHHALVPFSSLRSDGDIAGMMATMPGGTSKIIVDMTA